MKYQNIVKGEFVSRPNRFIAQVVIDGTVQTVHVKNSGRCKELLLPGSTVYLSVSDNPLRKTKYDLIAVIKERKSDVLLINMDSQVPNDVVAEWIPISGLFSCDMKIRREVTYGASRFDIFVTDGDRKAFVEVKGVTLENNGAAAFPDAPTVRGVKHIRELIQAAEDGYEAYLLFVIQMKGVSTFSPNRKMHPEFADALKDAHKAGVKILARDCVVTQDSICIDAEVPVNI